MEKSKRNKTITLDNEETQRLLSRCVFSPIRCDVQENTVVCGDCLEIAKNIQKNSIDLLIVDPPYNLTKIYGNNVFNRLSNAEYEHYTRSWIEAYLPTLKENASIYVCCDVMSGIIIAPLLSEYFKVRQRITWQREKGRGAQKNWKSGMEDIWFCTKGDDYTFNLSAVKIRREVKAPYTQDGQPKDWFEKDGKKYRDTCPSGFWDDITVPYWSMPENTEHPTQKPEKLIAKLILASSNENDIVLDPFGGSGTTAVTAFKLNRKFIIVEKEKQYCALCQKRLEIAKKVKQIQGFEDGIFYARGDNPVKRQKNGVKTDNC